MRRLVQSKSVMVTLIALYMCASLAAIPMPKPVASFMANIGLSIADSASDGACSCGEASACSTSGSCCCAVKAVVEDDGLDQASYEMGFELMSINCTPELKWLLAAVPPVFETGDGRLLNLAELKGERLVAFGVDVVSIHNLDVLSPPPRSFS